MKDEQKSSEPLSIHGSSRETGADRRAEITEAAEDRELSSLLKKWPAPGTPPSLDARVIAAFQGHTNRPPLWRRLLTASIPVPVPAAAVVVVLLSATSFLAFHTPDAGSSQNEKMVSATTQAKMTETGAARESGSVPGSAASSSAAPYPERATVSPEKTPDAKTSRQVFVITLQDEQGTIHYVTQTQYRLIPVPKIFAGGYFTPSEIR